MATTTAGQVLLSTFLLLLLLLLDRVACLLAKTGPQLPYSSEGLAESWMMEFRAGLRGERWTRPTGFLLSGGSPPVLRRLPTFFTGSLSRAARMIGRGQISVVLFSEMWVTLFSALLPALKATLRPPTAGQPPPPVLFTAETSTVSQEGRSPGPSGPPPPRHFNQRAV